MRKSSNLLIGVKLLAFLLELISLGLSNEMVIEKACEYFNLDKEALDNYL